jgi:uncharacterized Zn-finger protein
MNNLTDDSGILAMLVVAQAANLQSLINPQNTHLSQISADIIRRAGSTDYRDFESLGNTSKDDKNESLGCDSNSNYVPHVKPNKKRSKGKSFTCNFDNCGKTFDYKWILERHINSHFCFKLFKCEYDGCDKAYKSKENLNLHIKNKHLGIKPYACKYCLLKFSHRNGM